MEASSYNDETAAVSIGAGPSTAKTAAHSLSSLPSELLFHILSHLPPVDLALVSGTSQILREHANNEHLWADLVNSNLPCPVRDPSPFPTFKFLYASHHPLWFVVRNKIWFSDVNNTGKLIIARYDHRRGAIEAYRLVARHTIRRIQRWERDPTVVVPSFEPHVGLWLDDPVVKLDKFVPSPQQNKLDWHVSEIRMPMALEAQRVFNTFILCSKMSSGAVVDPSRAAWPPQLIPADERADITHSAFRSFRQVDDRPQKLEDICESAFRVRRWLQFSNHSAAHDIGTVTDGVSTFSTLRPDLYTPTEEKPYQGIWVGDYSAHGSEFLLILQRDSPDRSENQSSQNSTQGLNGEDFLSGATDTTQAEPPSGGNLEAIKLTGDINVPRGEISFTADDIGPRGLIRIADEEIFEGARVIRSRGHVAAANFRDDTFIPSQLFLISHDCIAHHWEELGHISYYRRVDIDGLLRDQ